MQHCRLGVNIDHVATLRQARGCQYPDPVTAAVIAVNAGADGITLHLREDRRHIQDRDVTLLKSMLTVPMNLEMAATKEMLAIACKVQPENCCLVPEKREELTTEGGLDVVNNLANIKSACATLQDAGIAVSLFIDPEQSQIDAAVDCHAPVVELHTGAYADAKNQKQQQQELLKLKDAARYAKQQGLIVNAGHGLHYQNVQEIAAIMEFYELNIGHSIVSHAVFVGLPQAVKEMQQLLYQARMLGTNE